MHPPQPCYKDARSLTFFCQNCSWRLIFLSNVLTLALIKEPDTNSGVKRATEINFDNQ